MNLGKKNSVTKNLIDIPVELRIPQENTQSLVYDKSRDLMCLWIIAKIPCGKSNPETWVLDSEVQMTLFTGGGMKGTQHMEPFLVIVTLQN